MKNLRLFILLSALVSVSFLNEVKAQFDATINPIGILWGNVNVGADYIFSENLSVEGQLGFASRKDDDTNLKFTAIPVTAIGKYYISPDDGADKFYVGAFLRYINRSYKAEDGGSSFAEYNRSRFGVGFNIGYKVVGNSGFVFDIGLGAGRAIVDNTTYSDSSGTEVEVDLLNIMLIGKLAIGYRFGR